MKLSDIIHYDVKWCVTLFVFKSNFPGVRAGVCVSAFSCTANSSYIYVGISMTNSDNIWYDVR